MYASSLEDADIIYLIGMWNMLNGVSDTKYLVPSQVDSILE